MGFLAELPEKLPLVGVRAADRLNACLGVEGVLSLKLPLVLNAPPLGMAGTRSGVFRPLDEGSLDIEVALGVAADVFGVAFADGLRGGGRKPCLKPSRKISSSIWFTIPASSYSWNFFHSRRAMRASSMESWPSVVEAAVVAGSVVLVVVFVAGLTVSSWMYSLKTAHARYRRLRRRFLEGWKNKYWVSTVCDFGTWMLILRKSDASPWPTKTQPRFRRSQSFLYATFSGTRLCRLVRGSRSPGLIPENCVT